MCGLLGVGGDERRERRGRAGRGRVATMRIKANVRHCTRTARDWPGPAPDVPIHRSSAHDSRKCLTRCRTITATVLAVYEAGQDKPLLSDRSGCQVSPTTTTWPITMQLWPSPSPRFSTSPSSAFLLFIPSVARAPLSLSLLFLCCRLPPLPVVPFPLRLRCPGRPAAHYDLTTTTSKLRLQNPRRIATTHWSATAASLCDESHAHVIQHRVMDLVYMRHVYDCPQAVSRLLTHPSPMSTTKKNVCRGHKSRVPSPYC